MTPASDTYETGFETELEPSRKAMSLKRIQFYGGILVNESGEFDLNLNLNGPRYTGHPTRELDAAWDELVGNYVTLNDQEAARINGEISKENGHFFVVPHVQHSLHCVNYLRKALYPKFYPTIHEVKETVPNYWTHIDHCIETLRETIQCNMDMTPVPHVWFEKKNMYIANTQLVHTCRDFEALQRWEKDWEEQVKQRNNA
ncbi:hypothetical protein P170DRAFT_474357 [Aspergillus steynii IBT 23096]|uniref:Tat pathway signal sequence n=1 Tax=Aspergillus steynii IBT 23096 TaxID=1392250 RepID=A0A2I2GD71_9EURO|nr:uncharacterized protein P170DRAFT_474357 [Aspergillus steynii IBT 23096]PLB50801.1 hypothetical protein P170DRAFT_474357 [Aspergillus steynii IBT 23096]